MPREASNTPSVRYRTLVLDPPWPMPKGGDGHWGLRKQQSRLPYSTMTIAEIDALPVDELADETAHLYLWTTNAHLERSFAFIRHWRFKPSQVLVWAKPPRGLGMGGAFTNTTEFVLFAWRGRLAPKQRVDSSWFAWSRGEHSRKPEAFLDLVESVSHGPYLELFARRNRLGWDTWGNEALDHLDDLTHDEIAIQAGFKYVKESA